MITGAVKLHDLHFKPFISEEEIQKRVAEMGAQLREKYKGQRPIFLAVLNGSFIFAADLFRSTAIESEITFIKLSSYDGLKSTGDITTRIGLDMDLKGRPIIIVEDIVDTGKTLHAFLPVLEEMEPKSVEIITLLQKPTELKFDLAVQYVGFEIPAKFVVGYGLDYDGLGRELCAIYQLV